MFFFSLSIVQTSAAAVIVYSLDTISAFESHSRRGRWFVAACPHWACLRTRPVECTASPKQAPMDEYLRSLHRMRESPYAAPDLIVWSPFHRMRSDRALWRHCERCDRTIGWKSARWRPMSSSERRVCSRQSRPFFPSHVQCNDTKWGKEERGRRGNCRKKSNPVNAY